MALTEIEKAEERVRKAREKLAQAKRRESARERKQRDTMLYTLGALVIAAHEQGSDEEQKRLRWFWDKLLAPRAPGIVTDRRREALEAKCPFPLSSLPDADRDDAATGKHDGGATDGEGSPS